MSSSKHPRVGVGVFVLNKQGEFLLGKRKGSHGAGTWALTGGHLEFGESFEECARRETWEECGLAVQNIRFLTAVNCVMVDEGQHYVTIFMVCEALGEKPTPQLREAEKCERWDWVTWEELEQCAERMHGTKPDAGQKQQSLVKDERRLFQPLVHLLQQRPGAVPQVLV